MASGRSVFLIKVGLAASIGQACQAMSCSPITLARKIGLGNEHLNSLSAAQLLSWAARAVVAEYH